MAANRALETKTAARGIPAAAVNDYSLLAKGHDLTCLL